MRFLLFGIIIISVLLALLPHIIYVLAKLVGIVAHLRISYRPFGIAALIMVAIWIVLAIYGNVYGRFCHEVKQVQLTFDNLPTAFDGLRIVHISDLHLDGWVGHEKELKQCIDEINALNPDIICFTGDLVSLSPNELKPFVPILRQLHTNSSLQRRDKRRAVYAVLGNHDYCRYGFDKSQAEQQAQLQRVREAEARMGWQLLEDTNVRVGRGIDTIVIAGVGCVSPSSRFRDGDLNKALQDVPDSLFTILLSHDPSHWRMEVLDHSAVVLTLSGHTHAAQMKIGSWSPAAMIYKEWSGLYESTIHHTPYTIHRYLYVSEGLGGTFPFRLGTTPQIVEITLQNIK